MQKFGEIYISAYKEKSYQAELANHGIPRIWIGHAENHLARTHHIFNPKFKKIILTWDVTFVQKSYSE